MSLSKTLYLTLLISFNTLAQNPPPNLILIVADDLGYGDLGVTGSRQIKTPHIDALAKTGVFCTQGYVTSPVCSPSRAGLLTGINQVSFGYDNNLGGNQLGFDPDYAGLPLSETTLASYLQKTGYTTGLIGKWHLGQAPQFHPLNRGFDDFWGYTGGGHDYFESIDGKKGYKEPIESNFKTPENITYLTDDKGDECVSFIERHKFQPFFLFASFNAPHTPMQALEKDIEKYQFIKNKRRRTYAAMVHRLDQNVGKIIQSLEENKLRENTLIVFISDNGGPCDSNGSINAPYNGQKGILLEGGIHIPFILNWPKGLPADKTYHETVSALDITPTFLKAAGFSDTALTKFHGVDLSPFLKQPTDAIPHDKLQWRFTISAAIRKGNWKLVRLPDRLPLLYNLSEDISEQNNLAIQEIDKTKELLKELGNWDIKLPHPVFLEGAIWKRRQLSLYDGEYLLKQLK